MREITDHRTGSGMDEHVTVRAADEPGDGGACHEYVIELAMPADASLPEYYGYTSIRFQEGPLAEAGINGLTNESLLAVVIDRMRGFAGGPFACRENAVALTHLETAMMWMAKRTRDRVARGVEGTHQK